MTDRDTLDLKEQVSDLRDLVELQQRTIRDLKELLDCRAGELLRSDRTFVVVAADEPYFVEVYNMIRNHEIKKDTWTNACEAAYREAIGVCPECAGNSPSPEEVAINGNGPLCGTCGGDPWYMFEALRVRVLELQNESDN